MEELIKHIPFNIIITGPTCCGKTQFLVEQISEKFRFVFEYIILICPTFVNNNSYNKNFVFKDPRFIVVSPDSDAEDEINDLLKCCRHLFSGTQTLIIIDDCAVSKDLKNKVMNLLI